MDVREKLVELVDKARRYAANKCHSFMACAECSHYGENEGNCRNAYIAESLIANGVTVQEWISVKDRLPEDWCPVLVMVRETEVPLLGSYRENVWFHEKWNTTFINGAVTHWMPLPQPPKGE